MKTQRSLLRSILLGLAILLVLVVYAYGFQVTKVNFAETSSERRLTQLTRILRALAHPDIFEYEQEELVVEIPFYLPCPDTEIVIPEPDKSGPYLVTDVPCVSSKEFINIEGFNLPPDAKGPINFITASGAMLQLGNFEVDDNGSFQARIQIPTRQPVAEAQHIRATARVPIGAPKFTETAEVTWDKIVETVFLALLATTFGTLLAIPISFVAARNLMSDVKSSLSSIALMIIGWPLGIGLGMLANRLIGEVSSLFATIPGVYIGGVIIGPVAAYALVRWALPQTESEQPSRGMQITRIITLLAIVGLLILTFQILADLALIVGQSLVGPLGSLGFLGNFISQLGDVGHMIIPALVALGGGAVIGNTLSSLGQSISDRLSRSVVKTLNIILAAIAGATLFIILALIINWFYEINDPVKIYWWPGGVGAVLGLLLALRAAPKTALPIGTTIYFITRTILNATRSVESLVMVIVFAVWVGIGPFAGALALALHTVAALAKLYSEQVESILPGPLEAIQATGANRMQLIAFAVVPQIIPPYISFTMYRWDINVRMSTIIGFAGGGGIGFLLQQNINLLDYRAASAQMIAIAIVVATMDFVSSTLRERFV
ncbi:MAG: ABC transporter permease subunit [Anaerolineaceae bacterium]|nr:MAG: ABC transporter permease subunit [Anaerolineaceae bacterium]